MANGHTVVTRPETMTQPRTTTAMVRADSVEPTTMAELKDFAAIAARSRFFGAESPEQALILAMAGKDLGFSYTQALRAFHVVKGKPTLSADGMVAACLARPDLCEYFRPVEVTETKATWETKPKGGEPVRYSFTMDDANKAGLVNDMYRKHPKRMLSARCKAYLARDMYPQILMGLVTEDEAHEIADSRAPQPAFVESHVVDPEPAAHHGSDIAKLADAAQSVDDLNAAWKSTAQARKGLSAADQAALKDYFAARKRDIEAAAAKPAEVVDADGVVHEAEVES